MKAVEVPVCAHGNLRSFSLKIASNNLKIPKDPFDFIGVMSVNLLAYYTKGSIKQQL